MNEKKIDTLITKKLEQAALINDCKIETKNN